MDSEKIGEKLIEFSQNKNKLSLIDIILSRLISRKLFVFITATGLTWKADLSSDVWGMIAVVYISTQAVIDAVKAYKGN
tara:strand:+ start:1011 stop:1247 length:237 start_codon:yes stop_codon:yes gene_type:complete